MGTGHPFTCLGCGGELPEPGEEAYRCRACGRAYPVVAGVPLFVAGLEIIPSGYRIPVETAARICGLINVPADERNVSALGQIFSRNYRHPAGHLDAENNYFLRRVRLADRPGGVRAEDTVPDRPVNRAIRYRITAHYLPDALPAGAEVTRNVRVENIGESVISSSGTAPVHLSYHWWTPAGTCVTFDGERTPLPIDLPPGWAITVPTRIRTPAAGLYAVQLALVHEGVAWLHEGGCHAGVDIVPDYGPAVPAHWETIVPDGPYTYLGDHERGRVRFWAEVLRRQRPGMRLLELGSSSYSMARGLGVDVYCVDIDAQTLQVGRVSVTDRADRLHFVCADAHHLPFAGGSFDGVAIFSALHHFADPILVLGRLKRLLRPGGFLAVMCEPVGTFPPGQFDPEFVAELREGINEQIFTPEEYHHIFRRAGLYSTWAAIEGGSFKVILEAEPAGCR